MELNEALRVDAYVNPSLDCRRITGTSPKTDRLGTELLKRGAWGLRGERGHCTMVAHPHDCRRGRQAAYSEARVSGREAHAARQPNEGHLARGWAFVIPTNAAQGGESS